MKVLITADIHLDEYSQVNYTTNARLHQFGKLAERYLELMSEHDCKEIWILGDFVRKAVQSNRANYALFEFINKLTSKYVVRYVNGNHDLNCKLQTSSVEDTILSLVDFGRENSNFVYMGNEVLHSSNNKYRYCFMDWKPTQDWSWVNPEPNMKTILCGHFTHSPKGACWAGQKVEGIEEFDKFIFGDIHKSYVEGKYYSIGTPLQNNMGDQAEGKVIIMETETSELEYVDVDADHTRFLRMEYTPVKEEEGFYNDGLTYKVYKPIITKREKTTSVDNWDNVETLISNVILKEGLVGVHSQVLAKNPTYTEMDFDFKLISLHVQGFRSLVDIEIPFSGDKDIIVLCGDNGSGKSSIITALTSMFRKNRYLKEDKSDLCNEFRISLKLMYQNKMYEIVKGDNANMAFLINGEPQHYSGIPEMEKSIQEHLPFIEYLDMMFMNSDSPSLEDKLSDDRRIKLIRKFYRLDRLTSYHDTAVALCEELRQSYGEEVALKSTLESDVEQMDADIRSLQEELEGYDEENVAQDIERMKHANDINRVWEAWNKKASEANADIMHFEPIVEATKDAPIKETEAEEAYNAAKKKADEITEQIFFAKSAIITEKSLSASIAQIDERMSALMEELEEIREARCPKCGQHIPQEEMDKLIAEVSKKLDAQKQLKEKTLKELAEIPHLNEFSVPQLEADLSAANGIKDETYKEYVNQHVNVKTFMQACQKVEYARRVLLSIGEEPQRAEVDCSRMYELVQVDSKFKRLKDECDKRVGYLIKISQIETSIREKQALTERYQHYIEATSDNGVIMAEILRALAEQFNSTSNGEITYEVETGVFRGKPYIEFQQFFSVKGNRREYSRLSSGQKSMCDIEFLQRLFVSQVGMLVMDETFKYLDSERFQEIQQSLRGLNVNTIIVSTHDPNFSIYTQRYCLTLDETGATIAR